MDSCTLACPKVKRQEAGPTQNTKYTNVRQQRLVGAEVKRASQNAGRKGLGSNVRMCTPRMKCVDVYVGICLFRVLVYSKSQRQGARVHSHSGATSTNSEE